MKHKRFSQFRIGLMIFSSMLFNTEAFPLGESSDQNNWNKPFFGQDPNSLGQQYLQRKISDQKKIDSVSGKNKSKSKETNSTTKQPADISGQDVDSSQNYQNYRPYSDSSVPNSGYSNTQPPYSPLNTPSDQPKSTQPPSGDLYRGY